MRIETTRRLMTLSLLLLQILSGQSTAEEARPLSRIAFGSCAKEDQPQPIWESIVQFKPDMFLFIGDNIYGDSTDMAVLQKKWNMLGAQPGYRKLKAACPILATWDDHDYGANDAGVEFPMKKESQKLFLDFFEEPANSPRRKQAGIYDAKVYGPPGKQVQIILLDTRYFRSPLVRRKVRPEKTFGTHGPYGLNDDKQATVLGEAQWKWLAEQLKIPAQVRIIASSIQVLTKEHGWEAWSRFPLERKRLLDLIASSKAEGVVFISGDRHHAELSKWEDSRLGYPVFDLTSSSLNRPSSWRNEVNEYRHGSIFTPENFGTILIDWDQTNPTIHYQIRDINGKTVIQYQTTVDELRVRIPQPE